MAAPGSMSTARRAAAVLAHLLSFVCLALVTSYMDVDIRDGADYTLDKTAEAFLWHPILMTAGMVTCYTNAILSYKSPLLPFEKPTCKVIHLLLQTAAVILSAIGLLAAFNSHDIDGAAGANNLYTPHGWVGLTAAAAFFLQYILGVFFYWFPKPAEELRASFMPVHVFLGFYIYLATMAAVIMGLLEKGQFNSGCRAFNEDDYDASACQKVAAAGIVLFFTEGASLFALVEWDRAADPKAKPLV